MAVALASLTVGSDGTDGTVYTTASVSPGANRLQLLSVVSRHDGSDSTPTVTGNGLTWVEVATVIDVSAAVLRTTLFRAMGSSPSAGAITITFGTTQRRCGWSLVEGTGCATGGTNGSAAIVQAVTGNADETNGKVVTLAAFATSVNATYGTIGVGSAVAIAPGGGFTEIHDQTIEAAVAQETLWSASTDTTVDWSWTGGPFVTAAIAVEIAASQISVKQKATDPGGGNVSLGSVAAGAFLVMVVKANRDIGATPLMTSVSGGGATWTLRHTAAAAERGVWIYTGVGTAGGTVTMTTTGTYSAVTTDLYELVQTDCLYDTGNAATGSGTAVSSGASATLASDDDLAIAGAIAESTFNDFTPGGGFSEDFETNTTSADWRCTASQLEVTSTAAVTGSYTAGSSLPWACAVIAIKPAAITVPALAARSLNVNQSVNRASSW